MAFTGGFASGYEGEGIVFCFGRDEYFKDKKLKARVGESRPARRFTFCSRQQKVNKKCTPLAGGMLFAKILGCLWAAVSKN